MRSVNWRFIATGLLLGVAAGGFFLAMATLATRSNDPVALMRTVGEVSGVAGALGLALMVFGLMGKRLP